MTIYYLSLEEEVVILSVFLADLCANSASKPSA